MTAAIAALRDEETMPDSGDTRADMVEMLRASLGSKQRVQSMRLVGTLLAEQERNPELVELFRERVIGPRREMMLEILRRGHERGEVPPGRRRGPGARDADRRLVRPPVQRAAVPAAIGPSAVVDRSGRRSRRPHRRGCSDP